MPASKTHALERTFVICCFKRPTTKSEFVTWGEKTAVTSNPSLLRLSISGLRIGPKSGGPTPIHCPLFVIVPEADAPRTQARNRAANPVGLKLRCLTTACFAAIQEARVRSRNRGISYVSPAYGMAEVGEKP